MHTKPLTLPLISTLLLMCLLSAFNAVAEDWVPPTQIPVTQEARLQQINAITKALAGKNALNDADNANYRMLLLMRYNYLLENKDATLAQLNELISDVTAYVKTQKTDYEIYAMLGSAQSYSSVFYKDNVGKMNYYAKKGIRMLDRMKRKAPNNLGVLLQRGITYSVMPAFLNKAKFALEDLLVVKEYFAKKDNPQMQNMVNFYLATARYHNDEKDAAISLWKSIANTGVSPWDVRANEELDEKD